MAGEMPQVAQVRQPDSPVQRELPNHAVERCCRERAVGTRSSPRYVSRGVQVAVIAVRVNHIVKAACYARRVQRERNCRTATDGAGERRHRRRGPVVYWASVNAARRVASYFAAGQRVALANRPEAATCWHQYAVAFMLLPRPAQRRVRDARLSPGIRRSTNHAEPS